MDKLIYSHDDTICIRGHDVHVQVLDPVGQLLVYFAGFVSYNSSL